MKKAFFLSAFIWCLLVFAACGKTEEEAQDYYDIRVESRILEAGEDGQWLLGMQYYQGEPVSIIAELVSAEGVGNVMDVYVQPLGKERQLLMGGVSREYRSPDWYLDGEGRCFIPQGYGVVRLGGDGKMLYHSSTDGWVKDICGLEDGRVILLTEKNRKYGLAELDPATGAITGIDSVTLGNGNQYIGASGEKLILLDAEGFWQVDLKKGTREQELPFGGTVYGFPNGAAALDFRVDGNEAGIIWNSGVEEQLARVNISAEREVIIVRGENFSRWGSWLKEQVHLFNQSNDTYYAVLEERGEGTAFSDFCTETNLKLAAGKGADIICEYALDGDICGIIDNGVFADLTPFMEASGMSEEDYFPAAFGLWKYEGKVYGVGLDLYTIGYTMDKSLLGGGDELTLEALLDIMLDPDEQRIFFSIDGRYILRDLLEGSEDLWGMVDWEKGTCDFSGELFSRMLQAAKRCTYDKQYDYPEILHLRTCSGFYNFETDSELESKNHMMVGALFDGGSHAFMKSHYEVMGINANSKHIEGAWQLLAFLLGEEAQSEMKYSYIPVNKKAFDRVVQREIEAGAVVPNYNAAGKQTGYTMKGDQKDLTQERADEIIRYLEDAKALSLRTKPLITIIQEETADYFNGLKSKEEVIDVLQNRVQLYLDEHHKAVK